MFPPTSVRGVVQLQNAPEERGGGGLAHAAGEANNPSLALAHKQVHLTVERHVMCARQLQVWRGEGHRRIDKHHIRLTKIALLMSPQHKTDGEATQGLQRGGERLGPLQVSDGDVRPLVYQIARQANPTAKGAESHDGDTRLVPGRRQRRRVAMIPWSRPRLLLHRVRDVLHVCQSPS